jgi:hypothetical protein
VQGFRLEKGNFFVLVGPKRKFPGSGGTDSRLVEKGKELPDIVGVPVGVDFDDVLPREGLGGLEIKEEAFVQGETLVHRMRPVYPPVFKCFRKIRKQVSEKVRKTVSG